MIENKSALTHSVQSLVRAREADRKTNRLSCWFFRGAHARGMRRRQVENVLRWLGYSKTEAVRFSSRIP